MNPETRIETTTKNYFALLESGLKVAEGPLREAVGTARGRWNPREVVEQTFGDQLAIRGKRDILLQETTEMLRNVKDFWVAEIVDYYKAIAESNTKFGTLGSGISQQIAPFTLLYDRVCVGEPMLNRADIVHQGLQVKSVEGFLLSVLENWLQLLSFRDLFIGVDGTPLLVLEPNWELLDNVAYTELDSSADELTYRFIGELTGIEFSSPLEALDYLSKIAPENAIKNLTLAEEVIGIPAELMGVYVQRMSNGLTNKMGVNPFAGRPNASAIYYLAYTPIMELTRQCNNAQLFGIDPIVGDQRWGYYDWVASRQSAATVAASVPDEQILALALDTPCLDWLSNVSLEQAMELRNQDASGELREALRYYGRKVRLANKEALPEAVCELASCLNKKLDTRTSDIAKVHSDHRRQIRRGVASFVGSTTLAVVCSLHPLLAIPGIMFSMLFGGKAVKDIVNEYREATRTVEDLRGRPLTLLADFRKKNTHPR